MIANDKARGRPRGFDIDGALAVAQALFHDKGYDAVGVAELTAAIGINPPSFYAAFGSKAALFDRVLDLYAAEGLVVEAFRRSDRGPADVIRAYMEAVARLYAGDARRSGCLVFEGARGTCPAASAAARDRKRASRDRGEAYVAETHPNKAAALADTVVATLTGLSAGAREGWDEARLLAVVDVVAGAVGDTLSTSK